MNIPGIKLLAQYKIERDPLLEKEIVESYENLVFIEIQRMEVYPEFYFDKRDFVSVGKEGLLVAIREFSSLEEKVDFEFFAAKYIRRYIYEATLKPNNFVLIKLDELPLWIESTEEHKEFLKMLEEKLSDEEKRFVIFHYYYNLNCKDIAELEGSSVAEIVKRSNLLFRNIKAYLMG